LPKLAQIATWFDCFDFALTEIGKRINFNWVMFHATQFTASYTEVRAGPGVTSRTVQRYFQEYLEGGIERLKQNKYAGTPNALNEQATSLKAYFEKHPPHTIAEAQNIIEKLTGLRRSRPHVWKFLRRLGMKCRKIAAVPGKVDEAKQQEQERFLREKLEPRLDDAEAGRRKIFLWTPPISSTAPFSVACGVSCGCSSARLRAESG
jgi:transposase